MRRMYSKNQIEEIAKYLVEHSELNFLEDITFTGDAKIFENIVDKDAHKRFVEDNITIQEITGVTKTYGKWALSGTHLLIVLALDLADTTEITAGQMLATLTLPDWIKSKISVLWGDVYVDTNTFSAKANDWTQQTIQINITKNALNYVQMVFGGNVTLTKDRHVRIAFDLLIDNE